MEELRKVSRYFMQWFSHRPVRPIYHEYSSDYDHYMVEYISPSHLYPPCTLPKRSLQIQHAAPRARWRIQQPRSVTYRHPGANS